VRSRSDDPRSDLFGTFVSTERSEFALGADGENRRRSCIWCNIPNKDTYDGYGRISRKLGVQSLAQNLPKNCGSLIQGLTSCHWIRFRHTEQSL
jgi:hypothetical protein